MLISEDIKDIWYETTHKYKKSGGRRNTYSQKALMICLQLKEWLSFPYRQTQGFIEGLFKQVGFDLTVPHHAHMARVAGTIQLPPLQKTTSSTPVYLVVDSTGLKICGESEWKRQKHGASKKRGFVKVHIAADSDTGEIVSASVTTEQKTDGHELKTLLDNLPADIALVKVFGDGAYDMLECYQSVEKHKAQLVTPPRISAVIHDDIPELTLRNQAVRMMKADPEHGLKQWKEQTAYHTRSLVESMMWRLKSAFGERVRNRKLDTQKTQTLVRLGLLNLFNSYGRSLSVPA